MSGERPKYLYEAWLLPYKPVVPNIVTPTDENHVYQCYNEKNVKRDKINRRIVSKRELHEIDKYVWDSNGNPIPRSTDYSCYTIPMNKSGLSIPGQGSHSSSNTIPEAKYDSNIATASNSTSAISDPGTLPSSNTNSALNTDATPKTSPNISAAEGSIQANPNTALVSDLTSAISDPAVIPSINAISALKTDSSKASPNAHTAILPDLVNPTSVAVSPTCSTDLASKTKDLVSNTSTTIDNPTPSAKIVPASKANPTSVDVSSFSTILAPKLEDFASSTSVSGIPTPSANILPALNANPASITPKPRHLSRRRSIPGLVIDSDLMSKLAPKAALSKSTVVISTTIPAPDANQAPIITTAAKISVTKDISLYRADSSTRSDSAGSSALTGRIAANIFPTVEATASVATPPSKSPGTSGVPFITEPQTPSRTVPALTTILASIAKPFPATHSSSKAVSAKKAVAAASFISASLSTHNTDSNNTTLTSIAESVSSVSPAVSYILSASKTTLGDRSDLSDIVASTASDIPIVPRAAASIVSSDTNSSAITTIANRALSSISALTISDIPIPSAKAAPSDSTATTTTTSTASVVLSGTTASTASDNPNHSAKVKSSDSPATSFISAIHASIGPKFVSAHNTCANDDSSPDPSEKSCNTGPKFQPRLNHFQRKLEKLFETPITISKAEKMMMKMGWSGGALGKKGGGIIEPITPNLEYVKTTKGLGRRPTTQQSLKPNSSAPSPNPAKRFKKTESSNPCLNIIRANMKRRMLQAAENQQLKREQKKSRQAQMRLERSRGRNLFKNNVLLCILEFVTNEREIGILFDEQLHTGQRKTIHDIVERIRDAGTPENKSTKGIDQALLGNITRKNTYVLQTQSEGEGPKRRLCLFKEAPKSMYLVTHYILNDRKTDYVKQQDENVGQAKKKKERGLLHKQRVIDAKQRKKAKQLRKALKRPQNVNAGKVEVEINIDEYKFVKDKFNNYVACKITDVQRSDVAADKKCESDKIKQKSKDMGEPMSDYDDDMLEDYFKSSDEDVEMTKPESHEELKTIFRIEDKKDKVQTAAKNINVKKINETKQDVDKINKIKKFGDKHVIKTRKNSLRHNLNKCFYEFLIGDAFNEFKFLGEFDTEEFEVMNEFLVDFFMAKNSKEVMDEEFSEIWESGDWNLGYKRDVNGGFVINKVTNKTE